MKLKEFLSTMVDNFIKITVTEYDGIVTEKKLEIPPSGLLIEALDIYGDDEIFMWTLFHDELSIVIQK